MSEHRESKAASSMLFKLLESFGAQLVSFVVSIVLARLLTPDDYAVLTMLTVFITLAQVFVQSGLNTALVQKKDADDTDASSVLLISLGIAALLYLLLFFLSPAIASFYEMPQLESALRVLALILFPGAVVSVEDAIVARKMLFRKAMAAGLAATAVSGLIGIGMAWAGLRHWALVGQQLSYHTFLAAILFWKVGWRPKAVFSRERAGGLFHFGWRILVSSLLDTGYNQLRTAVIGKRFPNNETGCYNRGKQFPEMVMSAVNTSIQSVMLPVLSESQEDPGHMKQVLRRTLMVSCFLVFPIMAGMAAVATPLVRLLLTDKWLGCVPFLQISCIDFAFYPVHSSNLQAINAQGRSEIFLILEVIKKSYGLVILLVTILCFHTAEAIVWGGVVSTCISLVVNSWPNRKLLNYGFLQQARDLAPSFICSAIMFLAVSAIGRLNLGLFPMLLLQVAAGIILYFGLSWLTRSEALRLMLQTAKSLLAGKRKEVNQ